MPENIFFLIFELLTVFNNVYMIATPLLLIFTFRKHIKNESWNILYALNTLLAWITLAGICYVVYELWMSIYSQNVYEFYVFQQNTSLDLYIIWGYGLLLNILGLLFFNRRLRINRKFIVIYYIIISLPFLMEVYYFFNKNYLPSSWSLGGEKAWYLHLFPYLLISLLLIFIYLNSNKKKKLPYPSLFLG